jgi:hypothetical protein
MAGRLLLQCNKNVMTVIIYDIGGNNERKK